MYSQLVVNVLNHAPEVHGALMSELDKTSRAVFKVILTGYGFWNLHYFRYLISSFCVSQKLKNIHIFTLQYVSASAFYPLLLIALISATLFVSGGTNHT